MKFPKEFLYPDYEIEDSCEVISEEVIYSLKYINSCSGEEFCKRNEHLTIKEIANHRHLYVEGTADKCVYVTNSATKFLRRFMSQPNATLKEALFHCSYCDIMMKKCFYKKIGFILYNKQEEYPLLLSSIIIPFKAATSTTTRLLLSLFNFVSIKFDNDEVIKLSVKKYNKDITFHSPLVDNDTLEIERRAEELGIELNDNCKIDEYGVWYSTDGKSLILAPTNLTFYIVKESTEIIGDFAFDNCTELKILILPQSVKFLGVECFAGCRSITYINLPNSITNIYDGVFNYCTALKAIEYPTTLSHLTLDIQHCKNLQTIKMPIKVADLEVFWGFGYECASLKEIQIPRGQLSVYKKHFPWINKNDFMQGFKEYVEKGCVPGKDIRYRELALDYCRFWQNDWENNSYYRCFNYGIRFIERDRGTFYYRPYRNIREQELWDIYYDNEEMNEHIAQEIRHNPFVFEDMLIAVSYYNTYCIDENEI